MEMAKVLFWDKAYDEKRDFTPLSSQALSEILTYKQNSAPKTFLDIGCGTGQLTRELFHRGYKGTGIDISEKAIKQAGDATFVSFKELSYLELDIEKPIPTLPHEPYGLITCKLVYTFIKDKPSFLSKVRQLLHENGIFVVITVLPEDVNEAKKHIATSKADIELLESYFTKIALYKDKNFTYFIGK